jgi:hypothetical protein
MEKLLSVCVLLLLAACTENKFSGSAASGPTTPSATANIDPAHSAANSNDPTSPSNGSEDPASSSNETEEPTIPSNGTGNSASPANGPEDPTIPSNSSDKPNQCVDGDTIKFTFEGPIKDCYDAGRVWNFDRSECVQMRQASFPCEWSNVIDAMAKIGISNSSVVAASQSPESKLVGCGESADRNRIVVQWVNVPEGKVVDCKNPELTGSVITGCFTFYPDNTIPPPPANQAERDKQVYACMSQL